MATATTAKTQSGPVLTDWRPEDNEFWSAKGKAIATRNLWISIPNLLLAFSVWMVWSVVVAKMPAIGFNFSVGERFLAGGTARAVRRYAAHLLQLHDADLSVAAKWTALSTASLLLPALGIGFAVQNPTTTYLTFLLLALLCGLRRWQLSPLRWPTSLISYPKTTKGNALALNAGLGNLGVSVMQFVVPIVITTRVFRRHGRRTSAQ